MSLIIPPAAAAQWREIGYRLWPVIVVALAGACSDSGKVAPMGMETIRPLSAASVRLVESRGRSWAVNPSDPFACFTSTAATSGPIPYLYNRHGLSFPSGVATAAQAVEALSYRVVDGQSKVLWVLNCTIPASARARAIVAARFGLYTEPEPEQIAIMGCVKLSGDGVCPLEPLRVGGCGAGWQGDYPNCYRVFEPECPALDPSCGGWSGGGDPTAGGGSGGDGSCTDCGPSTPILACSSVQRGANASCDVGANGGTIPSTVSWTFTGGGRTNYGAPGALTWGGIAVQSGQVSVALSTGSTLQATFTVTDHGWRWQRGVQMLLSHGTAPLPIDGLGYEEWVIGAQTRLGWNCTRGGCGSIERVQPSVATNPRAGYEIAQVPSGPNAGFWYVSAVSYKMDRETALNRSILPGAARHQLAEGWQASQCRAAMLLPPGTRVVVNLYEFNKLCVGSDIDGMIAGAWNHEELGSTGTNGHEGRAYHFAGQPAYDPYFKAGDIVSTTEADLRARVVNAVQPIQNDLETLSADHTFVTGNWSGSLWLWDGAFTGFVQTSPITNI